MPSLLAGWEIAIRLPDGQRVVGQVLRRDRQKFQIQYSGKSAPGRKAPALFGIHLGFSLGLASNLTESEKSV